MKQSSDIQLVFAITYKVESETEVQIEDRLGVEALAIVMINFESDCIKEYDKLVAALDRCKYWSKPKKFDLEIKNYDTLHARPFVEEAPKLDLMALPLYLGYAFLGKD